MIRSPNNDICLCPCIASHPAVFFVFTGKVTSEACRFDDGDSCFRCYDSAGANHCQRPHFTSVNSYLCIQQCYLCFQGKRQVDQSKTGMVMLKDGCNDANTKHRRITFSPINQSVMTKALTWPALPFPSVPTGRSP